MKLSAHIEQWQAKTPFRITGKVFDYFDCVVVEIEDRGYVGRGEALGIFYLGETVESIMTQLQSARKTVEKGIDREGLLQLLPPGGTRHALDQALWDLEAKTTGRSIWSLAGLDPCQVETGYTIGIEASPEKMAACAKTAVNRKKLKVKLDGHQPLERMRAIRAARPDATIYVDANQAWSIEQLREIVPAFAELGIVMIEQPLPRDGDAALEEYHSPIPLCADESCLHLGELEQVARRYQMINIKLDKAGGLTHSLELARAARERGLGVMVGCMGGTSLAMAPAYVLASISDYVDIDGPLWLRFDRAHGMDFNGSKVSLFSPELWG